MKKYELTDETKDVDGHILHRIRALRDFGDVYKGDLGGWIESESNLSQDGKCWVSWNAEVYGNAKVFDDAWVSDNAWVSGNAWVYGDAWICENAEVSGNAKVFGDAWVSDNAWVSGNAEVFGDAWVSDNAWVSGNAEVYDVAEVYGDAHIVTNADYAVYKDPWSSGWWLTYTRSNKKWAVGSFYGTGRELIAKAYSDSPYKGACYEAVVKLQERLDGLHDAHKKEGAK